MIEFIIKNKEWLFSGVGVVIITGAYSLFKLFLKKKQQAYQSSDNSKSILKAENHKGASTDKTPNYPIPGFIHRDQLPKCLTAESLYAIRESTNVRELRSSENQMFLRELPDGIFGYIEAYMINTPRICLISESLLEENFSLNKNLCLLQEPISGGFAEIHKAENGQVYLVGFVTEEDRIALQNPVRSESIKIVVSLKQHEKRSQIIAIPRERLEWWRCRQLGDGECIGDARVT